MKKKEETGNQEQTHKLQLGLLRDLVKHPWWKVLKSELEKLLRGNKEHLWKCWSDYTPKFTFNNLVAERIVVLYSIMNIPHIKISDIEQILATDKEQQIPAQERLEKANKKLSEELTKWIWDI